MLENRWPWASPDSSWQSSVTIHHQYHRTRTTCFRLSEFTNTFPSSDHCQSLCHISVPCRTILQHLMLIIRLKKEPQKTKTNFNYEKWRWPLKYLELLIPKLLRIPIKKKIKADLYLLIHCCTANVRLFVNHNLSHH